ncbi:sensor histidine kinase [Micromonospora cathayae]|uniref:histidine kinase n=1 Tax=Micromonospora cathayae TaxID=3028804 RepID=A0ABY7ZWC0_9ACTN|nr:histidine kinase [Micromonospora sp. HUAS 3]WDZ87349.1 histidine kinase [Micromonospora sp. HUAS 3]
MGWATVRAWGRQRPWIVDVLLGLALVAVPGLVILLGGNRESAHTAGRAGVGADVVAVVATLVMLAGRRRWPAPMLVFGVAVSAGFLVVTGHRHPLVIGTGVIVTVTFAARTDRRGTWLLVGGCAAVLFLVGGVFGAGGWWSQENVGTAAWWIAAVAFGDAARSRRAYVAEVEARARRAEETREEEARRRVAEERLRIARELHDVVAHHIAVINVQAGAAAHVLSTRPEAVAPALAHIRRAADTVLKELGSVVGVLRGADDREVAVGPTRGLARLSELLDGFAAAGLRVEHRQHGTARELPAVVDLAAYRIVQEALTNAQKHGTGEALLVVTYGADRLLLDVTNVPVARKPDSEPGYGLVGMRERASAAGGTVTVVPDGDGRFRVHAELPAPREVS